MKTLSENESLAAGYATLYQGNSATGASPAPTRTLRESTTAIWPRSWGPINSPVRRRRRSSPPRARPSFCRRTRAGRIGLEHLPGPDHRRGADRHAGLAGRASTWVEPTPFAPTRGSRSSIGSIAHTGLHVTINSPLGGQLRSAKTSARARRGHPERPKRERQARRQRRRSAPARSSARPRSARTHQSARVPTSWARHSPPTRSSRPRRFISTTNLKDTCSGETTRRTASASSVNPRSEAELDRPRSSVANLAQKKSWNRSQNRSSRRRETCRRRRTPGCRTSECCQSSMILV